MVPLVIPADPAAKPRPLKRLLPRGALSSDTWRLISRHQEQLGFGWAPVTRAIASHATAGLAFAGVATFAQASLWTAVAAAPIAAAAVAVAYRGLENLVHGAAHDDIAREHPRLNDLLGDLLMGAAVGQTIENFRKSHLPNHHAGFGGPSDPCADRMRARSDVGAGRLPGLWETLRSVSRETVNYARTVGRNPSSALRQALWQGLAVFAPLVAAFGPAAASTAYGVVAPLAFIVILPTIRALAEAGEHDYAQGPADAVLERTFDNIGVLNGLLHPYGDGYHILHHLAPRVPQHRLGALMRKVVAMDSSFAALARRRRGVLTTPEPYLVGALSGEDIAPVFYPDDAA